MKVIKRDGHMVEWCPEKVEIAIERANTEVEEEDQASSVQIKNIIKPILLERLFLERLLKISKTLHIIRISNKLKIPITIYLIKFSIELSLNNSYIAKPLVQRAIIIKIIIINFKIENFLELFSLGIK